VKGRGSYGHELQRSAPEQATQPEIDVVTSRGSSSQLRNSLARSKVSIDKFSRESWDFAGKSSHGVCRLKVWVVFVLFGVFINL
jgi:hypothetical protein